MGAASSTAKLQHGECAAAALARVDLAVPDGLLLARRRVGIWLVRVESSGGLISLRGEEPGPAKRGQLARPDEREEGRREHEQTRQASPVGEGGRWRRLQRLGNTKPKRRRAASATCDSEEGGEARVRQAMGQRGRRGGSTLDRARRPRGRRGGKGRLTGQTGWPTGFALSERASGAVSEIDARSSRQPDLATRTKQAGQREEADGRRRGRGWGRGRGRSSRTRRQAAVSREAETEAEAETDGTAATYGEGEEVRAGWRRRWAGNSTSAAGSRDSRRRACVLERMCASGGRGRERGGRRERRERFCRCMDMDLVGLADGALSRAGSGRAAGSPAHTAAEGAGFCVQRPECPLRQAAALAVSQPAFRYLPSKHALGHAHTLSRPPRCLYNV